MNLAPSPPASTNLDRSRAYCEELTRTYARNFYYGLRLLPSAKRDAMYALYAWMRLVDDIADNEDGRPLAVRIEELEAWRAATHAAMEGRIEPEKGRTGETERTILPFSHSSLLPVDSTSLPLSHSPLLRFSHSSSSAALLWPAFCDMVARYHVPAKVFDEVIAGQQQDLSPLAFQTFDELYTYCYRVAGVVGLASIYVWGFEGGKETEEWAVQRGIAFQLTNILRDLREDAARGRFYLPRAEVNGAMELSDLRAGRPGPSFEEAMRFQLARAQEYYRRSAPLESRIAPDARPTLVAMTQIYHSLLRKIAARPARVLQQRVSLSVWAKLRIGWRALRARP
jgi:phytoene synthase